MLRCHGNFARQLRRSRLRGRYRCAVQRNVAAAGFSSSASALCEDDCGGGGGVTATVPLHWGEMDAFQHLNNVAYFRHFETARIVHFEAIVERAKELNEDFHIDGFLKAKGVGPILASTSCRYRRPVVYPDTLTTRSSVTLPKREDKDELGRFTMEYTVTSEAQNGAVVATGEGEIVVFDYVNNKKSSACSALAQAIAEIG